MTTITDGFEARDLYLGRAPDGMRVYFDVTYGDRLNSPDDLVETVEHAQVRRGDIPLLSITGYGTFSGRDRAVVFGAGVPNREEIARLAPGLVLDDLGTLRKIAERWHLNTLISACAHMDTTIPDDAVLAMRYGQPDETGWLIDNVRCSATDVPAGSTVKYGATWFAETVPADALAALAEIIDRARR